MQGKGQEGRSRCIKTKLHFWVAALLHLDSMDQMEPHAVCFKKKKKNYSYVMCDRSQQVPNPRTPAAAD